MRLLPLSLLFLAGCATPPAPTPAELREAERAAAAMARYRARQEAEKPPPSPAYELLPLRRTAARDDGVRRDPPVEFIRIPLNP